MKIIDRLSNAYKTFMDIKNPPEELSSYESPYYKKSQVAPYNPDTLYEKKGSLDVYQDMLVDDQVKAVLTMKKHAVLSTGWKIEPASESQSDKDIADFVHYCFTDGLAGSFRKNLLDMLTALEYGFSVTEQVYRIFDNKYKGKIGLKHLKTRPPHSFAFVTDDKGDLKTLMQHTGAGAVNLDPKKFVIYSYNSEFGNYYGNSDLRAAYRSYFSKDIIIRFWNIYLERFGMPPVIGKYPRGANKTEQDDLMAIIKNFQSKNAIKLPEGFDLELLEATRRGDAGYIEAIEKHNIMIARAVLLPDLLGYSETKGGAYNLGEKHFDVFLWVLENLRGNIEETVIFDQIIKPLVDMNFVVQEYPRFKFYPLTTEDRAKMLEIFIGAVEKGIILPTIDDEEHIRNSLSFPKKTKPQTPEIVKQATFRLRRAPTKYERKVNFTAIVNDLDEIENDISFEVGKIIGKLKDDLISSIFRKKIIEDRNIKEIEKLDLKYLGDYRLVWKDALRKLFMLGRKHARAETTKKLYAEITVGNLPPKEALEFFERKAFWITGVEKDKILKETKTILYGGLERGETNAEVMFRLEEFFEQYKVQQRLPTGELARVEEIPGRLETIVRTNSSDAYNQGRLAMFQDELVRDFVVAYQYSSIIDDRTTEFCEKQDGRIYKANDPIWSEITPPNHFNCRATIVPVLSDEEHEIDRHLAIKPDKNFGG